MSGLLAYTTGVSPEKSVGEITGMLSQARARQILQEYDGAGNVTAIAFRIATKFGEMAFRLPVDLASVDATLKAEYRSGAIPRRFANDSQHSRRVAWRILRHWLEAQLALIKVGQARIEQVFLPYAQDSTGATFFEHLEQQGFRGTGLLALPPSQQPERVAA